MIGYRDLSGRVGDQFIIGHRTGDSAAMLDECRAHDGNEEPASFSVTFRTPSDMPVEQGLYRLSADGLDPEPIFLVPIAALTGDPCFTAIFEAVFNTSGTTPGGSEYE